MYHAALDTEQTPQQEFCTQLAMSSSLAADRECALAGRRAHLLHRSRVSDLARFSFRVKKNSAPDGAALPRATVLLEPCEGQLVLVVIPPLHKLRGHKKRWGFLAANTGIHPTRAWKKLAFR
jgi:hypothetical protein